MSEAIWGTGGKQREVRYDISTRYNRSSHGEKLVKADSVQMTPNEA